MGAPKHRLGLVLLPAGNHPPFWGRNQIRTPLNSLQQLGEHQVSHSALRSPTDVPSSPVIVTHLQLITFTSLLLH